jgi:hypothetical protein
MFHRYFSGFRLSSAAVALLLLTAGLYLGACRSDKGEKTEKTTGTESSAVSTSAPSSTETPSGQTGESDKKSAEGLPPEITEPCSGKNEGDACSVIITGGQEIKGTCAMTRKNILGCKPLPITGHQNPVPSSRPPDLNKNPEKLEDMNK